MKEYPNLICFHNRAGAPYKFEQNTNLINKENVSLKTFRIEYFVCFEFRSIRTVHFQRFSSIKEIANLKRKRDC